jgi:prepilin-type N-terminal cleavage/methylation domain-containing protein
MNKNGFTLLEIVISMLILGMVVVGAYSLFVSNNKLLQDAKVRLQAVSQAFVVFEKLKMYVSANPDVPTNAKEVFKIGDLNADDVIDSLDVHSPDTYIGLGSAPSMTGVFNQKWNYKVEEVANTDLKKITVTVNWDQ